MEIIQIYGENYIEQYAKIREACRGIVVRNGKILLTYEVNTNQWFIPGGGLESNEGLSQCCIRELAEETGCVVEVGEQYLTIKEHYDDWLWVSHYYICNYIGKTERILTQREYEVGLETRWISLEKAMDIFSKYKDYADDDKMKQGAYFREYKALLSYIETSLSSTNTQNKH